MPKSDYEVSNARISNTMLGFEDHGILTFVLEVDYGNGSFQGFGTYMLSKRYEVLGDTTLAAPVGLEYIRRVLETVGVERWERLKGNPVRVLREPGYNGLIKGIGNFIADEWFIPQEEWPTMLEKVKKATDWEYEQQMAEAAR